MTILCREGVNNAEEGTFMIKRKITHGIISLSMCALISLFLVFEETLTEAARNAMHLSALHVIPTLFPYMVISSTIVSLGLLDPICRFIPTHRILRLPQSSAPVILTGMIGGFPTGALGACKLYESGVLTREDAGRVCALSSCASPAFIIGTVGAMWGREYALFLLITQTVTAFAIAAILARGRENHSTPRTVKQMPYSGPTRAICTAIYESALSCVGICGYIVFFRVIASLIGTLIPSLYEYAAAVLEFSSGAAAGASYGGVFGISLTGFAVGFAGVSVFMQTMNITSRHAIPFTPIFVTKLAQGALLSLASAVFYAVFSPEAETTLTCTKMHSPHTPIVIVAALFASLIIYFAMRKKYFSRRY